MEKLPYTKLLEVPLGFIETGAQILLEPLKFTSQAIMEKGWREGFKAIVQTTFLPLFAGWMFYQLSLGGVRTGLVASAIAYAMESGAFYGKRQLN